jgi:DNA-directed RNA polymerase subunit RPC12/RpoP
MTKTTSKKIKCKCGYHGKMLIKHGEYVECPECGEKTLLRAFPGIE